MTITHGPIHLVSSQDTIYYEVGRNLELKTRCGRDATTMSHHVQWTMYKDEFFNQENRCPECESHPDLALELLAGAGEDPEPNNLSFTMNTRTGRLYPVRPNYQNVPRIHKVYID